MSGAADALLREAIGREVSSIAFCWKLTRGDGVVLGFTSHDAPLRVAGITFQSRPGMTPSAVSTSLGFEPDNMAVAGALSTAAVRAVDLDVGRWDGARVELYCCDWSLPQLGLLLIARGFVGDVARRHAAGAAAFGDYSVELVSEIILLQQGGAPRCSPVCRAELGDRRCGVDMAGRHMLATVEHGEGATLMLTGELEQPLDYLDGTARFLTGPLGGIERRIQSVSGRTVVLQRPIWMDGAAGAVVRLSQGCDKRFETCVQRFGNGSSFDGEPHVPGTDALIRYGEG